jgi:diguanylate cyclase (GGDEF)-like protein
MTWAYRNAIFTRVNGQRLIVGSAQDITDKARRKATEKQTREQIEAANIRLQEQTSRLRNYNQQLAQLHSLTQAMQSGKTVVEAMSLALGPLQELFAGCAIGIYVKNPSTDVFSKAAEAGRLQMKSVLSPSECSSLRDGLIRAIDPNCSTCLYSKKTERFKGKAYAIPLRDEDEIIGLLVVENRNGQMPDEEILESTSDHMKTMLRNKLLQQELTEQSTRDALTGLLNRRFMEETLRATVARAKRTGEPLAVVMLDIDHFKRLNDTFGHQAGDEALRIVSRLIQKSIRTEDVACRYGGEEFALIMPGATLAIATARAESLRRAVSQLDLNHIALGIKGITISAGVSTYSSQTLNETTLIAAADEALYIAKDSGRNRVVQHGRASTFPVSSVMALQNRVVATN